jgi:beta-ureidopropionase / N-carbamoyl-L-amino-acid hydrolase
MNSFNALWTDLLDVGRHRPTGGYRRFAWTDADLTMREWFHQCAQARGMTVEEDRNTNLWAWWMPDGWEGEPRDAFVTGSHLDSVPDGGAFDGPLGVVSAFAAIDMLRNDGVEPRIPIAVVAFADEEGARFGVACIGSQLSTGTLRAGRALALRDIDGITLGEAVRRAGRNPANFGPDPHLLARVAVYVELHIEQGRALDTIGQPVAVASSIWPHGRWEFAFAGQANHAGTTKLADRRDPMLAFASSALEARSCAENHSGVATFGKVIVSPNGTNAIPSQVRAWLDARAIDDATLRTMVEQISNTAASRASSAGIELAVSVESLSAPVEFPSDLRERLQRALGNLGPVPILSTAAGHDAGILSSVVPTAMLFVRNPTGMSHCPDEFANIDDCHIGVTALAAVIRDWAS